MMAGKGQFSVSTPKNLKRYQELRDEGYTIREASNEMGLTFRQGRYLSEQLKQSSPQKINQAPKQHKVVDDQGVVSSDRVDEIRNGQDLTDEQLLKLHGLDPSKFEITSVTSNFWGESSNGEALYQTKIKASPKSFNIEDLADVLNEKVQPLTKTSKPFIDYGETSLIVPLFDLHFGINTQQTVEPYLREIQSLIQAKKYYQIAFVIGGDYFHSDYMTKTMTALGTQLDHVDSAQALIDGTRFISALITSAYQQATDVSVYQVRGNHDEDKEYVWGFGMKHMYSNDPIDWHLTLRSRDCFQIGHVAVMYSHGDKPRQNKLAQLFAVEYPQIWADCKTRLILTGHYHTQKTTDDQGVMMMQQPTSKPTDPYEDFNGFTMSQRRMEVLEVDDQQLLCTHYIQPEMASDNHIFDGLISYD